MITLSVESRAREEAIDITAQVQQAVTGGAFQSGVILCTVPHTTAGIMINERADPDVPRDIFWKLRTLIPQHDGYHHAEGNSDAHLKAALIGSSVMVPLEQGTLRLGTWQGIFFCEFDGPRSRELNITVLPHA